MIFVLLFGILNKTNNKLFGGNNIKMFFNTNNNKIEIQKNYNIKTLISKYNIWVYNNHTKTYYPCDKWNNFEIKITYDDGSEIDEFKSIIKINSIQNNTSIYNFIENYFKPIKLEKDIIITPLLMSLSFPNEKSKDFKLFILKNNYNVLIDSSIDSYGLNKIYDYVKEYKKLSQKLINNYRKYILNKYYKYIFKIPLIKDNSHFPNYYIYDEKTKLKIPINPYITNKTSSIDDEKIRYYYLNNNFKYLQLVCYSETNKNKISNLYVLDTNIPFKIIINNNNTTYSIGLVDNKCVLNIAISSLYDERPKYIRLTTNAIDNTDTVLNDYELYLNKEFIYDNITISTSEESDFNVEQESDFNVEQEYSSSTNGLSSNEIELLTNNLNSQSYNINTDVLNPRMTNLNVEQRLMIIETDALNEENYINQITIRDYIEIIKLLIESANPERYSTIFWETYYDYLEYKLLDDISKYLYMNNHYLDNINDENYNVLNNILNDYNLFPANDIRYISDTLHSIDNTNIVNQQNEDIDINTLIENYLRDFSRYDNN